MIIYFRCSYSRFYLKLSNDWIFVVVQNWTMISDCSLPPLGCNGVSVQTLWKTEVGQLCSKTSKEKLFWWKICHKRENPRFSTLKNKTTWSNMQKSPVVRSTITPYICNSATTHCSRHRTNTTNDSLCWKELTQSKSPGITGRWDKHLWQVRIGRGWSEVTEKGVLQFLAIRKSNHLTTHPAH